jgi:transposase-like protein
MSLTRTEKQVAADLKPIYQSAIKEEALLALEDFDQKWSIKYPPIPKSIITGQI